MGLYGKITLSVACDGEEAFQKLCLETLTLHMILYRKVTLNLGSLPWKPSEQTKGISVPRSILVVRILLYVTP
jgi:hypothetical protein